MTQRRGSRGVRIIRRIADDEVKAEDPPAVQYHRALLGYALDLYRIPLADRLMRVDDLSPSRYQQAVVYFLVEKKRLRYIGQTVDWGWREKAHRDNGRKWDETWTLLMPDDWPWSFRAKWLNSVEQAMIGHFDPPDNLQRRYSLCKLYGELVKHAKATALALPDGITVGERRIPIVYGPSMAGIRGE